MVYRTSTERKVLPLVTNAQLAERLHQAGCHAMAKLVAAQPDPPPLSPEVDAKLNEIFGTTPESDTLPETQRSPITYENAPFEVYNVERDD